MTVSEQPRAKVAAAKRLISRPKDLIAGFEGKHIAVLALGFGTHTFQEGEDPTVVAEVAVVDVEADPPQPVAVLQISWRRVIGALRLAERGVWQVGRLQREEEFQAVELLPPTETFDLDRVAVQLAELESSAYSRRPALPVASDTAADNGDGEKLAEDAVVVADDDIPF